MKKIGLVLLVVLLASFAPTKNDIEKEINWITIEEAIELQKKEPKKIIMDVYTNWCGPCKMLDKHTFHNEDVVDYINEHYYAVKFNGEGNESVNYKDKIFENPSYDPAKANRRNSAHEFTRYLGVRAYPTMVFFDEEAKMITPVSGYLKPKQIEVILKFLTSSIYAEEGGNIQEKYNTYSKSFKGTFKE